MRSARPRSSSTRTRAPSWRWRPRPASTRTASRPSFRAIRRTLTVTDIYEPGSTFKLVTVAAALAKHLVTARTSYTLPVHDPGGGQGHPRRGAARHRDDDGRPDPFAFVERRRRHARPTRRRDPALGLDLPLRVRRRHGHRLPRRERGHRASRGTSGTARRSARFRSARASLSHRSSSRRRTPRSRTGASG